MKFSGDKKYLYWGITAFLVLAAAISFFFLIFNWGNVILAFNGAISVLMPVIEGLVMAYCFNPLVNFFESKIFKKEKYELEKQNKFRIISIVITLLLFFLLIYGLFAMIIPEISDNVNLLIKQYPQYEKNVQKWTQEMFSKYPILNSVFEIDFQKFSGSIGSFVTQNILPKLKDGVTILTSGIFTAVKAVINLILGIILSVYLLYNRETFIGQSKKVLYALLKRNDANSFIHNIRFTNKTFQNFLIGKLIDSLIIGLICFICMTVINLPYQMLVSVIIGVTNIIPLFGPLIGAIPASVLIFMVDPKQCLYFIILIIILQQFDGNILGPKILGSSTGLSGFWVVIAITIFGSLFGVLGMIIGVPAFAVLYAAFKSYINSKLKDKNLDQDTVKYQNVSYIDEKHSFINIPKTDVVSLSTKKQEVRPKECAENNTNENNNEETDVKKEKSETKKSK